MKKIVLTFVLMALLTNSLFAEETFKFGTATSIELKDLIYFISWLQADKTDSTTTVLARAQEIYTSASGPLSRLPANLKDDLNGDGVADIKDLIFMIAWWQADKTNDFAVVEARAKEIMSSLSGLSKLPGTPLGSSSFSTTITGIVADP